MVCAFEINGDQKFFFWCPIIPPFPLSVRVDDYNLFSNLVPADMNGGNEGYANGNSINNHPTVIRKRALFCKDLEPVLRRFCSRCSKILAN